MSEGKVKLKVESLLLKDPEEEDPVTLRDLLIEVSEYRATVEKDSLLKDLDTEDEEDDDDDCDEDEVPSSSGLALDPCHLMEGVMKGGRFPSTMVSREDLPSDSRFLKIVDSEFRDWLKSSREALKSKSSTGPTYVTEGGVRVKQEPGTGSSKKDEKSAATILDERGLAIRTFLQDLADADTSDEEGEDPPSAATFVGESRYRFCPWCSNLLQVDQGPEYWRFKCVTCPYVRPIVGKYVYTAWAQEDGGEEGDDIVETSKANEHRQKTEVLCPTCNFNEAYFYQMQTRSADEPMTTFYECCNQKCKHHWRD